MLFWIDARLMCLPMSNAVLFGYGSKEFFFHLLRMDFKNRAHFQSLGLSSLNAKKFVTVLDDESSLHTVCAAPPTRSGIVLWLSSSSSAAPATLGVRAVLLLAQRDAATPLLVLTRATQIAAPLTNALPMDCTTCNSTLGFARALRMEQAPRRKCG